MPLWLLPLLKNKWTWRIAAVLAVAAALLYVRHYYIELGKQQGAEQQKQSDAQQIEDQRALAHAQAASGIAQAQADKAEAEARAAQAEAQAAQWAQRAASFAAQRQQAAVAAAQVPDAQVHQKVVEALAIRPAGDLAPGYTYPEEHAILGAVTELPLALNENQALAGQLGSMNERITAVQDQVAAMDRKYEALSDYSIRLEGWYVQLYNLHPKKKRAAHCLFLWKCGTVVLPVPDPKDLKGPQPQGGAKP